MVINDAFSKLVLNTKEVNKDIFKEELERRKEAMIYAVKRIKENIGNTYKSMGPDDFPSKRTGNLQKGIGYRTKSKVSKYLSVVGSTAPHSYIVEFGHGDGKEKNKRPFFNKTLMQENDAIIGIMSRKYW